MVEERNRICILFEKTAVCDLGLSRWLMPTPNVADLAGQSRSWLDVESLPGEDALLREFFAAPVASSHDARIRGLLDMEGLLGAVLILAHAGHGNHLGLQSSLTADGAAGHDLRPDHEALFMQVAAAGVTITLAGSASAVPELWPPEIDRDAFIDRAVTLAEAVCDAAAKVHELGRARKTPAQLGKARSGGAKATILRPRAAVIEDQEQLPDINSVAQVAAASEAYYEVVRSASINPGRAARRH